MSYISLVISDVGPVVPGVDAAFVDHDCVEAVLQLTQLLLPVVHLLDRLQRNNSQYRYLGKNLGTLFSPHSELIKPVWPQAAQLVFCC